MKNGEIGVGSKVRYPRTGSSGVVEEITEINGVSFAGMDSTGLYYRTSELILVEVLDRKEHIGEIDELKRFKNRMGIAIFIKQC